MQYKYFYIFLYLQCLQSHNTTRKQSQNIANTTAVSDDIQT